VTNRPPAHGPLTCLAWSMREHIPYYDARYAGLAAALGHPLLTADARPAYWDVVYNFRGQQHRVQMTSPPGQTVTVNGAGEPRAQQRD